MKQSLGKILVAANLIDEVQMHIALAEQERTGNKFGSTLVDLQFIDENVLAAFLSKQHDIPCISLLNIYVPRKVLRKIPPNVARECQAIPLRLNGSTLEVAMVDPVDSELLGKLEAASGMTVQPLIAPQTSIVKMVERFYPPEPDDDEVVSVRRTASGAVPDPMFLDLIEELESGDFEDRLVKIEQRLSEVWVLLERIARSLDVATPGRTEAPKVRPR